MQVWNVYVCVDNFMNGILSTAIQFIRICCVLFLMFEKKAFTHFYTHTHAHIVYLLKIQTLIRFPSICFQLKSNVGENRLNVIFAWLRLKSVEQWVAFEKSYGEELMNFPISKRYMTFDNVCTEEKFIKKENFLFSSLKKNNRKEWNIIEQWAVNEMNNKHTHTKKERKSFGRNG